LTLSDSATWTHFGTTTFNVGADNNTPGQAGGTGTLTVASGASLTITTTNLAIGRNLGKGTVNIDGGSITLSGATGSINLGPTNGTSSGGTGVLNLNSGTITASRINVAQGTGTLNLNGGIAIVGSISKGTGNATANFNGTTIVAAASSGDFFAGYSGDRLNIQAGGQRFDTGGNSVIITQGMTGVGGLTKLGDGILTLNGANSYAGATTVEAGVLQLGTNDAIADVSNLTLSGGTFALDGFGDTVGTLKLTTSSTLDFGAFAGANSLVFGDSSGIAWSGSLSLANFEVSSDTLSFSSPLGLTSAQLRAISLPGFEATRLDASGVVQFTVVPEPAMMLLLAGGCALLALRRRSQPRFC
jgi:fibronectin-binding autotransporter adhesin